MRFIYSTALCIMLGLILAGAINNASTDNAKRIVFTECNKSRMSATISETRCGELQDKYGIEFICDQANSLATNKCWTEVK